MVHLVNNHDLDKTLKQRLIPTGSNLRFERLFELQGRRNIDATSGYQFRTGLSFEKGKQIFELDLASFLGRNGNGNRAEALRYCNPGTA